MKMKRDLFTCLVLTITLSACGQTQEKKMNGTNLRYVALGDSYTICEGAKAEESWPVLLTKHLNEKGVGIDLVANPSRTGWTTQNLIDAELQVLDVSKADFVTLCIGVNDYFQHIDSSVFHKNLSYIIDHIQKTISDKNKLILITIPDYSVTPSGAKYSFGRDVPKGIAEFNAIILGEAKKRDLKTVDLYEISKGMKGDATLVANDGLHPSAKEYALWEKRILPVVLSLLKK